MLNNAIAINFSYKSNIALPLYTALEINTTRPLVGQGI